MKQPRITRAVTGPAVSKSRSISGPIAAAEQTSLSTNPTYMRTAPISSVPECCRNSHVFFPPTFTSANRCGVSVEMRRWISAREEVAKIVPNTCASDRKARWGWNRSVLLYARTQRRDSGWNRSSAGSASITTATTFFIAGRGKWVPEESPTCTCIPTVLLTVLRKFPLVMRCSTFSSSRSHGLEEFREGIGVAISRSEWTIWFRDKGYW